MIAQSNTSINTEYAGGIFYENGVLEMIPQPEGYIQPKVTGGYEYAYQYKDHLGNVRISYSDTNNNVSVNSSEILSEKHYYPFGLQHKGYGVPNQGNATAGKFKFGGKELNDELGLDLYDFHARNYDPALGRFTTIDPLAEDFASWTPYHYVHNNPINMIDPTGMSAEWVPDEDGNLIAEAGDNAASLAEYLDVTETEAANIIDSQGLSRENYVETDPAVIKDQKLELDNNMKDAIAAQVPCGGQNCHSSSQNALEGTAVNEENSGNPNSLLDHMSTFDRYLNDRTIDYRDSFTEVSKDDLVFGKTLVTFRVISIAQYIMEQVTMELYTFGKGQVALNQE